MTGDETGGSPRRTHGKPRRQRQSLPQVGKARPAGPDPSGTAQAESEERVSGWAKRKSTAPLGCMLRSRSFDQR